MQITNIRFSENLRDVSITNSEKDVTVHIRTSEAIPSNLMSLLIQAVTSISRKLQAGVSKCFTEEVQKYSSYTDWTDKSKC